MVILFSAKRGPARSGLTLFVPGNRSLHAKNARSASARMPLNSKRGIDTPRSSKKEHFGLTQLSFSSDEYCPHCDNHFVLEAVTPKPTLQVEGGDARMDSRYVDGRRDSIFAVKSDVFVECSRMTAFGAIKNDPYSIYAMCPTGWARGWSIDSSPFHDPNDFHASLIIQPESYYPPPG